MDAGQKPVELILARHLAGYLSTPIFLVDPDGNLLFYNEGAEQLLGRRFDETGPMPSSEWSTVFTPSRADGSALPPEEIPLIVALRQRIPSVGSLWITGLDGARRGIEVSALPLTGLGGRFLGALAVFWESEQS